MKLSQKEDLLQTAHVGVPMDVGPEGDLVQDARFKNHTRVGAHEKAVIEKAVVDKPRGRAMVVMISRAKETRGLRVSTMGAVEEKEQISIIHDLTFGGYRTVEKGSSRDR